MSQRIRCGLCVSAAMVLAVWLSHADAAAYTVAGESGQLRSGPGSEFDVVATLTRGTNVVATGRQANWLEVQAPDGQRGWLFRGLAEPVQESPQSTPQTQALLDEDIGDYWLLAVGINRYQHWPALNNAVGDARAVVELLSREYGFDPARVITLYDEQATEENLFREFLHLKDRLKPNDSLLIYYAGHGVLDEFDTASWVPVDARQNALSDYIATDRINRILGKLPARHIFLVADACYSGSLFSSRGATAAAGLANDRYFRENIRRISRQALSSGGIEPVMDGGAPSGHSVFAHHFLSELERDTSPYMAASSLSLRVQELVSRNSRQQPVWDHLKNTGDENGEFFFLRNPAGTADAMLQEGSVPDIGSRLTLHSYPFGAAVRVNGEAVGTAPVTLTGLAGNLTIEANMTGYISASEIVRVRYDRAQTLVLRLAPTAGAGHLAVITQPDGARWYLNGAYMGTTPDQAVDIAAGIHVLTVSKDGFPERRQTVRVFKDQVVTARINLANSSEPARGMIQRPLASKDSADKAAVVAAAQQSVAQITHVASESHAQRRSNGMDQLEKLIGDFVGAYQLRDRSRLEAVAELSVQRQAFLDQLFATYRDIDLRLVSLEVTDRDATVTLKMEKLVRANGDEVIPAPSWDTAHLLVSRDGNRWTKIHWH